MLLVVALCCALVAGLQASPISPQREIIPLNAEAFAQPEYVQALAKELEKEGVAELKSQAEERQTRNARNDYDSPDYGHSQKFTGHRKPDSTHRLINKGFSETIIYPSDIIEYTNQKRNFDEIDRSGFSGFNKKRNFDEIDRTGFSGFNKRNFDEIDRSGFSGFNKRNFDEIDRTGFSGFNKRNFDEIDRSGFSGFNKRNFDEIDRSGFSGFNKRNFDEIDRSGFSGFNKRNFDEIDRSGFSGFNRKRNFDEIDRSGVPGFAKRSIASSRSAKSQRMH
ncbi:hypothetical protein TSAR_006550 [Trichomalopsis sarcophagae]|uniref:Orcokinin n=1 Tax=Trichomalopsis sarcophagae TaxID=543379 RepID=A0A232FFC1_9HYME|nr:hypothetical protein TSAR_006550 [Trichomalopsis sarcophagae]